MKKIYKLSMIAMLALFVAGHAFAQQVELKGKVQEASGGEGIPGVNILEKGTANGATSNASGEFAMKVSKGAVLVFSFIGYASQEITVADQTFLTVNLATDVTQLSEIVVIGYGEVQKKDATGAVVAIGSKDFNKGVITSPQDLLVGKLAGVQVTTASGAPGSGATIRIRGGSSLSASNDPLIVIDGFPVDNSTVAGVANPLASLNPNDIESFTVLKDASATAIYGSRASNGVIIVTTKKGTRGKPQFSYNGAVSVSSPIKYYDVLSADEFRSMTADMAANNVAGVNTAALTKLGTANTDWQKEIYRNAVSNDHNISVSGSAKQIPYRVSYGYTDQQGTLKTTSLQRQSLNLNFTPSLLNDDLKINASLKGSKTNNNFGNTGAVGAAISFDPTQPVYDPTSKYGGYYTTTSLDGTPNFIANSNPVALLDQTDNKSVAYRFIGNLQADYKLNFLPGLKATLNTGIDITKSDGHDNAPDDAAFTYRNGIGQKKDYTAKNHSELLDLYVNYVKQLGAHKIDFTAGYSWQHFYRPKQHVQQKWRRNYHHGTKHSSQE